VKENRWISANTSYRNIDVYLLTCLKWNPFYVMKADKNTRHFMVTQYMEGHHNQLTHETINPAQRSILGPNAAYFDVLVEVKKAEL